MGAAPASTSTLLQPSAASGASANPTLAICAAASLGAASFVPVWVKLAAAAGLGAGALVQARAGAWLQVATALSAGLLMAAWTVPALTGLWPAPAVGALTVTALIVIAAGGARSFGWVRRGALGGPILLWTVLVVTAANGALLLWYLLLRPPLDGLGFPDVRPALLLLGVLGWSILNAATEEALFRGLLLEALRGRLGDAAGVAVQAAAFGLIHFRGVPGGWSGVALATMYGAMLGALRLRAGGMLAVVVAHVFADLTIVAMLRGLVG